MCASEETKGFYIVSLRTQKNQWTKLQTRPQIITSSVILEIIKDKKYKTLRVFFYI